MRLNLGCGDLHLDGYINIDLREDVADVVADVRSLPYEDGEVSEIRAEDLLEHFPAFETQDILREWARLLSPGGELILKVPNMQLLSKAIVESDAADQQHYVRMLIRNIYGGHRWGPDGAWDTHHTGWTPETLREDLDLAGFDVISNDESLNMTVEAKRR